MSAIDSKTQAKARASVEALLAAAGVVYERLGRLENFRREAESRMLDQGRRIRELEAALVGYIRDGEETEDLP